MSYVSIDKLEALLTKRRVDICVVCERWLGGPLEDGAGVVRDHHTFFPAVRASRPARLSARQRSKRYSATEFTPSSVFAITDMIAERGFNVYVYISARAR